MTDTCLRDYLRVYLSEILLDRDRFPTHEDIDLLYPLAKMIIEEAEDQGRRFETAEEFIAEMTDLDGDE